MSGHLLGSAYPSAKPIDEYTAEELLHVRKVICGYAEDSADAALLLTMLGLRDA